jgi:hypothetical protein
MVYIGMAAAIGQSCEIPALLRSMACDLYRNGVRAGNDMDLEFLLALDSGTPEDDLTAVADSYYLQWWSSNRPPSQFEILATHNIDRALDHHRSVTAMKNIIPLKANKLKYTWSRGARQLSFDPQRLPLNCDRCQLYRGVSVAVLDNIQDLRHLIAGFEVTSGYNNAVRRASGFFQLYEAALMLETTGEDVHKHGTDNKFTKKNGKRKLIDGVQKTAEAELNRLRDSPSLKWTCGPDFTEDDAVKAFRRSSDIPFTFGQLHSGYRFSLPFGRGGQDSEMAMPMSPRSSIFSSVDDEIQEVPELSLDDIPHHFCLYPLRNYQDEPSEIQPDDTPSHTAELAWLQPLADNFFPTPPRITPPGIIHRTSFSHDGDDSDDADSDSIISVSSSDSDHNGADIAIAALMDSDFDEGLCVDLSSLFILILV